MLNNRTVLISHELMQKIDEYRGSLSRGEFISQCMEKMFLQSPESKQGSAEYITRDEFEQFKNHMEKIQQDYIDFVVRYAEQLTLENPTKETLAELSTELRRLISTRIQIGNGTGE